MNYETLSMVLVLVLVLALIVIRVVKKNKDGEKPDSLNILMAALPLIQEAMDRVQSAKEDGVVTEEEFVELVSVQLHALLLESPLSDSEKALITPELVRFVTKTLVTQVTKVTDGNKEEKKKVA